MREAATRGVITESEMRRRAESVSQAALIVRANEDRARKKLLVSLSVAAIVVAALLWAVLR